MKLHAAFEYACMTDEAVLCDAKATKQSQNHPVCMGASDIGFGKASVVPHVSDLLKVSFGLVLDF